METAGTLICLAVICLANQCTAEQTVRQPRLFGDGNNIFMFPVEKLNATTAESKCRELSGELAPIFQPMNHKLDNFLSATYRKDLQRVWIWRTSGKPFYAYTRTFDPPTGKSYKWKRAHLPYIDLHKTRAPSNNETITFCRHAREENWYVSRSSCSRGWILVYQLYTRANQTNGYKKIYNYRHISGNPSYSTRLTDREGSYHGFYTPIGSFFVPENALVKVATGAAYSTDSGQWLYSDGTPAKFSTKGLNTCQRKVLQYGTAGWKLSNTECNITFYCVCQLQWSITIRSIGQCKPSMAVLTPSRNFHKILKMVPDLEAKVAVDYQVLPSAKGVQLVKKYTKSEIIVSNLLPRKRYRFKATLNFTGSQPMSVTTTTQFETGYKLPAPVRNFTVIDPSTCTITIPQHQRPDTEMRATHFKIIVNSSVKVTSHTFVAKTAVKTQFIKIPLEAHCSEKEIDFRVQRLSGECNGPVSDQEGRCVSPGCAEPRYITTDRWSTTAIVVLSVLLVAASVLSAVLAHKYRKATHIIRKLSKNRNHEGHSASSVVHADNHLQHAYETAGPAVQLEDVNPYSQCETGQMEIKQKQQSAYEQPLPSKQPSYLDFSKTCQS